MDPFVNWRPTLTITVALAVQLGLAIWWAGVTTSRVSALEMITTAQSPYIEKAIKVEAATEALRTTVDRIDTNVNFIIQNLITSNLKGN